jgi:outer membrane immunogenic protein
MKKTIPIGLALLGLLSSTAMAADMRAPIRKAPPPLVEPISDWAGIYIGGSVGVAFGENNTTFPVTGTVPNPNPARFGDTIIGGGHIGVQGQWSNWVLGVEANFLATDLKSSVACANVAFSCRGRVDEIFTIGPRAGMVFNSALIYVTGGYATGNVRYDTITLANGTLFDRSSVWHSGAFVGGGVDWKIPATNWIIGANYNHVHLNASNDVAAPGGGTNRIRADIDIVQARLSYKFNLMGPVVARY